jgi:hypothetical protein
MSSKHFGSVMTKEGGESGSPAVGEATPTWRSFSAFMNAPIQTLIRGYRQSSSSVQKAEASAHGTAQSRDAVGHDQKRTGLASGASQSREHTRKSISWAVPESKRKGDVECCGLQRAEYVVGCLATVTPPAEDDADDEDVLQEMNLQANGDSLVELQQLSAIPAERSRLFQKIAKRVRSIHRRQWILLDDTVPSSPGAELSLQSLCLKESRPEESHESKEDKTEAKYFGNDDRLVDNPVDMFVVSQWPSLTDSNWQPELQATTTRKRQAVELSDWTGEEPAVEHGRKNVSPAPSSPRRPRANGVRRWLNRPASPSMQHKNATLVHLPVEKNKIDCEADELLKRGDTRSPNAVKEDSCPPPSPAARVVASMEQHEEVLLPPVGASQRYSSSSSCSFVSSASSDDSPYYGDDDTVLSSPLYALEAAFALENKRKAAVSVDTTKWNVGARNTDNTALLTPDHGKSTVSVAQLKFYEPDVSGKMSHRPEPKRVAYDVSPVFKP